MNSSDSLSEDLNRTLINEPEPERKKFTTILDELEPADEIINWEFDFEDDNGSICSNSRVEEAKRRCLEILDAGLHSSASVLKLALSLSSTDSPEIRHEETVREISPVLDKLKELESLVSHLNSVGVRSSISLPGVRTRSRGPVKQLPHVQERTLEYRRGRGRRPAIDSSSSDQILTP